MPKRKATFEECLAADVVSETPLEFQDGEIFPIAEASLIHAVIQSNLARSAGNRLDGKTCVVAGTLRVGVNAPHYLKPDLLVYCGDAQ